MTSISSSPHPGANVSNLRWPSTIPAPYKQRPVNTGKAIDALSRLYSTASINRFFVEGGAQRAAYALVHAKSILLLTGFNVEAGMPTTDGPPGAAVLAKAMADIGIPVTLVVDRTNASVMERCYTTLDPDWNLVDLMVFVTPRDNPLQYAHARELLDRTQPEAVVAVDVPGRNVDGVPKDIQGQDIGGFNAALDAILLEANVASANPLTVGIGDDGNEAGMGSLTGIPTAKDGSSMASNVPATVAVTAWNANLGAEAVAAIMVKLNGRVRDLTSGEMLTAVTRQALEAGAVDAVTRGRVAGQPGEVPGQSTGVDGFDLSLHARALDYLNQVVLHA